MRTKHVAFLALILLLPWVSACTESEAWMSPVMLGGGVPVAGGGDCDWTAADYGWNGEATDPDNACLVADSTIEGTEVNGDEITSGDATYGYIVTLADTGDQLKHSVSTSGIQFPQGFCRLRINTADMAVSSATYFFRLDDDATSGRGISLAVIDCSGSECVYLWWGNDATIIYTTSNTITESTWTDLYFGWNEDDDFNGSGASAGVKIGANAWEYENDADVAGAGAYVPETIIIGTDSGAANNGDVKVEGLECWDDDAIRLY